MMAAFADELEKIASKKRGLKAFLEGPRPSGAAGDYWEGMKLRREGGKITGEALRKYPRGYVRRGGHRGRHPIADYKVKKWEDLAGMGESLSAVDQGLRKGLDGKFLTKEVVRENSYRPYGLSPNTLHRRQRRKALKSLRTRLETDRWLSNPPDYS
jgi:hypothetical protein